MIYEYRPELHPRNRLGRFIEVLGDLKPGDSVNVTPTLGDSKTLRTKDRVNIEKRPGGGFRLRKRGGRVVDTKSVDYAAKAGLTGLKEMSPEAKDRQADRARDSILSTVERPRKGLYTPGTEPKDVVRPPMSPGAAPISPGQRGAPDYEFDAESLDAMTPGSTVTVAGKAYDKAASGDWESYDGERFTSAELKQRGDVAAARDRANAVNPPQSPGTSPDETLEGAQKQLLRATIMRDKALADGDEALAATWQEERDAAQSVLTAIQKEEGLPVSPPEGMGMSASDLDSMKLGSEIVVKGEKWTKGLADIPGADLGPALPGSAWRNDDGTMLFSADLAKRASVSPPRSPGTDEPLGERQWREDGVTYTVVGARRGANNGTVYTVANDQDDVTADIKLEDLGNVDMRNATAKARYDREMEAERERRDGMLDKYGSGEGFPDEELPDPPESPGIAPIQSGDRVVDPDTGRTGTYQVSRISATPSIQWDDDPDNVEIYYEGALEKLPEPPQSPGTPELADATVSDLAAEIRKDWKNVNFAAKPYLDAMDGLGSVDDQYFMDSGRSIVSYFLSNASGWRGERAAEIKKELKRRLGR